MTETGKPVPEVVGGSGDLGINETTLASWVSRAKRAEKVTPEDKDALIARLTAESAALKKENKELGMERDVLKRCMVVWVKELRRTRPPWPG
ncbi:transposase [Streptomyces lavendulae]|uniref:transposase n=1 Tax=Streptomyces lavendulae TaxID=1914 RepID=UPI0031EF3317